MLLASLLFAAMGVCVKFAALHFNSAELVFWRGLIGVLFIWAIARVRGIPLATPHLAMHAWRSLVGVFALGTWFYALAHLPLATAMTLNYMSSIWIAMFLVGGVLLASRPVRTRGTAGGVPAPAGQGPLVLAVLAGFVGVVLLLRPSVGAGQSFAASIGLLSGLAAAFAYMQVMALAKVGEPEARTVFYFAAGSGAVGAVAMLWTGVSAVALGRRRLAAADRFARLARPALHDACLQLRRDAGGGEPAILRHRVRRDLRCLVVRRPDPAARLGRHGADRRERGGGHRAARTGRAGADCRGTVRCAAATPLSRRPTFFFWPIRG